MLTVSSFRVFPFVVAVERRREFCYVSRVRLRFVCLFGFFVCRLLNAADGACSSLLFVCNHSQVTFHSACLRVSEFVCMIGFALA